MARPKVEELQKHTLNLRKGDMEALDELFPKYPSSVMVRRIISKFVDKVRSVPENNLDTPDIDL
jgi:hypothetical protein